MDCNKCIATEQMRASHYCTKTVIKQDNSFVPECLLKARTAAKSAEYTYLMCPTYNLGLYEVCNTCPLDCIKNPNKSNSDIKNIISMLGNLFGFNNDRQHEITKAIEQLNQPEFNDIYKSIERSSKVVRDVMNGGKSGDVNAAILKSEANYLKNALDILVKDGKITDDEVQLARTEIESLSNVQKLKTLLQTMKK